MDWLNKYSNDISKAQTGINIPRKPVQNSKQSKGQFKAALKQYNLNLHKYELENNPNRIKGETDLNYTQRQEYNKFRVDQVENKNPVKKWYNEMDASQEADHNYVTKTIRKVGTSPIHIANYIDDLIDIPDTQKYKNTNVKSHDLIKGVGSAIDLAGLVYLPSLDLGLKKTAPVAAQVLNIAATQFFNQGLQDAGTEKINNITEKVTNKYIDGGIVKAQQGKTIGNLTSGQTKDVEAQRMWLNNWNKNRKINNKKVNSNINIPFSEDIYIDELNPDLPQTKQFREYGQYDNVSDRILLDKNYTDKNGIPSHEFNHRFQKDLKNNNLEIYNDYINTPIQNISNSKNVNDNYLSDPEEIHSELMRMRYNNNYKPNQIINSSNLKNVEDYNLKQFNEKEITELLNTTASNEDIPNFQDGGTIPKLQNGAQLKKDSPEYAKLWKEGNVQNLNANGEENPYWGGQLDEVVIQNHRKEKGFWEQYRDKIVEENKDSGLLGAIIGTPISAVASLPQLAMMKALTGKMQRPSEAVGFDNQQGLFESLSSFGKHASNFALDAVTDPANLIGAGVLTKENMLFNLNKLENLAPKLKHSLEIGKEIIKNPKLAIKETVRVLKKIPNQTEQVYHTFMNRNKPLYKIGADNLENALKSKIKNLQTEEGFNRLVDQELEITKNLNPYSSDRQLLEKAKINANARIDELSQTENLNKSFLDAKLENPNIGINPFLDFGIPKNNAHFQSTYNNAIDLNQDFLKKINKDFVLDEGAVKPGKIAIGKEFAEDVGVFDHEINHALQNGRQTKIDKDIIEHFTNLENRKNGLISKKRSNVSDEAALSYLLTGSRGKEPSSFLAEARRAMLSKNLISDIYEPITSDIIEKSMQHFYKHPIINKYTKSSSTRIFDIANKNSAKFLADQINKLPAIAPIAGASYLATQNQEEVSKKKNGGIIEDDRGQWAHPGKVTKINSNRITMKDVNQSLLGISDTGDMQLMFPNQEYKFKGKNVTEFPIAKNGKSINNNWLDNY